MTNGDQKPTSPGNGATEAAREVIANDAAKDKGGRPGKATGIAVGGQAVSMSLLVGVGAGVLVAAGVGIGLAAALGGGHGSTSKGGVPATTASSPTPSASGAQGASAFPPNKIVDGCLKIEPQGSSTVIAAVFTLANPESGTYTGSFAQSPTGPLSASGSAAGAVNAVTIPMRATAFGTYSALSITAPDGSAIQLGTITQQLPLELDATTDIPNACDAALLNAPPTSAQASSDAAAASAFLTALAHDFATGNVDQELATLNPAVIQRYGADQCRSLLPTLTDSTAAIVVGSVSGPAFYDYASSGVRRLVPDTFAVEVTRTEHGTAVKQTEHIARTNDGLTWFTACGTPLPGAP